MLYSIWTVKNNDYKCALTSRACIDAEKKLGKSLLSVLTSMANDATALPPLGDLLTILHASLQKYEHGIKMEGVYELYDAWIDEGHSYIDLIPIVIEIYQASGLIPKEEKN